MPRMAINHIEHVVPEASPSLGMSQTQAPLSSHRMNRNQTEEPSLNPSTIDMGPSSPGQQSQSLSRSYGSVLPTSLTYIVL